MKANQFISCPVCGQTPCNCTHIAEGLRDPKDNPCWKGYHPVGTKKKNGRTVPNCVPNATEGVAEGSLDEISASPDYLRAAERSRSQAKDTQRQYWKSPEEKAAARRTELKRDAGIAGYSKRHRAANPDMYPAVKSQPAPKLRDPSTEYSDDYSVWAKGRRDTMEQGVAEGSLAEGQYEMMLRNGQVKKFVAKDDADAKRIAAGHGAKSVIRLRGGVPAGKLAEQGVAEAMRNTDDPFDDMVEDYLDYLESIGELRKSREEEKADLIADLEAGHIHPSEIEYALSGTKWDPLAEGPGFDKWADERAASQIHKLKNPHPKTWHDVDKKLGRAVDKMSQAEKVKKGLAHPDTLKKKGVAEGSDHSLKKVWDRYSKHLMAARGDHPDVRQINKSGAIVRNIRKYVKDHHGQQALDDMERYAEKQQWNEGVAEAVGLYGPFTATINTGERPKSRTKTKKFRREDDAILWAQDWLENFPQYSFATAEVKDPDGNVVWTTDEEDSPWAPAKQGVAEGYTVTRGIDRERYQERQGLEGPFSTKSGKVVYYDKVEGKYYDPDTDMYIDYDDWRAMNEGSSALSQAVREAGWGRRYSSYHDELSSRERDEQNYLDQSKRAFKRAELQHELGHEDDPNFERNLRQQQIDRDRGPWYIRIDGKVYRQKGQPKSFDWKRGANNYALAMIKNNPSLQGKIMLTKSAEDR